MKIKVFLILCFISSIAESRIIDKIYNSNKQLLKHITYTIKIDPEGKNNAEYSRYAFNWCSIKIYQGLINAVKNNHELARVIGHEMAHCVLKHTKSTPANEYAADNLGAQLAANAGYDMCKGAEYLKRRNSKGGKTHPPDILRYKILVNKYCK